MWKNHKLTKNRIKTEKKKKKSFEEERYNKNKWIHPKTQEYRWHRL